VVRAFCVHTWGWPCPDKAFLLTGSRPRVDGRIGDWTFGEGGRGLRGLGKAREVPCFGCVEWRYQDATGTRLLAEDGIGIDTIILTQRSPYEALPVKARFVDVATDSGIRLGDPKERVVAVLGEPSHVSRYEPYEILWYLGLPTHHKAHEGPDYPDRDYSDGQAAAYALERSKTVEIWLHSWTTQALGG
jgi:hypothetical protein